MGESKKYQIFIKAPLGLETRPQSPYQSGRFRGESPTEQKNCRPRLDSSTVHRCLQNGHKSGHSRDAHLEATLNSLPISIRT